MSFFGCWSSWKTKPNMWSDAGCTYASLQYQHATTVALSAGQYIGVAPGDYIHLTLGDDTTDAQVKERIDQMLLQKMPQETGHHEGRKTTGRRHDDGTGHPGN